MKNRCGFITGIAGLLLVSGVGLAAEADVAVDTPKQEARPAPKATPPAQCTHAPGSRIRLAKPQDCAKAARGPYRSYTKEDLDRTGETNVSEALRKLDPAFR